MHGARTGADAPLLGGFKWMPWGLPFAMLLNGWLEAQRRYPSPMGLDNHRQATGRDSGGYPKTVTYRALAFMIERQK